MTEKDVTLQSLKIHLKQLGWISVDSCNTRLKAPDGEVVVFPENVTEETRRLIVKSIFDKLGYSWRFSSSQKITNTSYKLKITQNWKQKIQYRISQSKYQFSKFGINLLITIFISVIFIFLIIFY